jgi:hypothetical protein
MDMKYDSSVMNRLVDATESRMVDAYNAYSKIQHMATGINSAEWDDGKRQEFDAFIQSISDGLINSIEELSSYLDYLKQKMVEFENRG